MDHPDEKSRFLILHSKIRALEEEVAYLQGLLEQAGISYDFKSQSLNTVLSSEQVPKAQLDPPDQALQEMDQGSRIKKVTITPDHANAFYSFFKGRQDVYGLRSGKPNKKTGKYGYYTQCANFWKEGVCPKRKGLKLSCSECKNQAYKPLLGKVLFAHLLGLKDDCSDVVGLYPMFLDETCYFLVFDFDDHEELGEKGSLLKNEVNALREICLNNGVDALVERSRSGNGAHVWVFFSDAIPAATARAFGSALLTKGSDSVSLKNFRYYDRMIPAQDHLSEGGLGNLIALPLQGKALERGNSAFVDENWDAYPDQWGALFRTRKLDKIFVEGKVKEWSSEGLLGVLSVREDTDIQTIESKEKPWKRQKSYLNSEDVNGLVEITLADQIYIASANLKPRIQNKLRRLAAYSNPEFYKTQALGYSTFNIPRIVYCGEDIDGYLCLPRGCLDKLLRELKSVDIAFEINDERNQGKKINVSFSGNLLPEQQTAAETMLTHDNGILGAATAFGKTVIGVYLIAEKKVNALILVHNTEIMKNWVEDLERFLTIEEEPPEYLTKTGRVKKRKSVIGKLHAGHNSLTGLIDIAMISSLGKKDEVNPIVKNYGMVLMDECHHGGAITAENVLKKINARYAYGLTATPKRDDGQEQKVFMQFGPVRYRFTAQDSVKLQKVKHYIYPRFTRLICSDPEAMKVNDAYKLLVNDESRNQQIIRDVENCIAEDRTPLVISKQRDHAIQLFGLLKGKTDHIFLLLGGRSSREKEAIRQKMRAVPQDESIILVATGQYIGEGFNYPRLDTMMLTMPISWSGNVEQYAGRLHRRFAGKKDVIIYDYVDSHIRVLERMYQKRMSTYKKMGYQVCDSLQVKSDELHSIFDGETYLDRYQQDLAEANQEIIVSSPGINARSLKFFLSAVQKAQERGVKIVVVTLDPNGYPETMIAITHGLIEKLRSTGIRVQVKSSMYEHFTVIDNSLVWYGSLNFLSGPKTEDSLIRIVDCDVARELMEITFA